MAFRGPFPDVEIPDVSLHDLLLHDSGDRADKPALIDGTSGHAISYRQLAVFVDQLAGALAAQGIGKGDVVAVFAP